MTKAEPQITEYLHPTKGWRKGFPRMKKRLVIAVKYDDGKIEWEKPEPKRVRITRGMFSITKPVELPA